MSDRSETGSSRLLAVGVIAGVAALLLAVVPAFGAGGSGDDANSRRPASEASAQAGQLGGTFFAVVNANGTLARGPAVLASNRLGRGQYEVIFAVRVRRCAYVATIGKSGSRGSPQSGGITTAGRAGERRGVFVATYSSRESVNRPFHLVVTC